MSKKRQNAATADSMKSIFSQTVQPPQDPPIADAGVDAEDDSKREGKCIDLGDEGVKGQVMGEQKDTVSHEAAHTSTCMIRSQGAKETTTGTKKGITYLTHTYQFCKGCSRKPGTKKQSLLR